MRGIDDIRQITDKDEFIKMLAIDYAYAEDLTSNEYCSTDECFDESAQRALTVIEKAQELTGVKIDTEELGLNHFLYRSDGE